MIHSASACSRLPEDREKHREEREGSVGKLAGKREKVMQKESKELPFGLIIGCSKRKVKVMRGVCSIVSIGLFFGILHVVIFHYIQRRGPTFKDAPFKSANI